MQDKEIRFKIDTGSQANILPAVLFESLKEVQLKAKNAKLTSYTENNYRYWDNAS